MVVSPGSQVEVVGVAVTVEVTPPAVAEAVVVDHPLSQYQVGESHEQARGGGGCGVDDRWGEHDLGAGQVEGSLLGGDRTEGFGGVVDQVVVGDHVAGVPVAVGVAVEEVGGADYRRPDRARARCHP